MPLAHGPDSPSPFLISMSHPATPRTKALLSDSLWYAAAAASIGAVAPGAAAQVVYTDVNPDAVITNTFVGTTLAGVEFDLDANGTTEILIAERTTNANGTPARYVISGFNDTVTAIVGSIVPYGGVDYAYFLPLTVGTEVGPNAPSLSIGTASDSFGVATFTFGGSDPNGFFTAGETYIGLTFTAAGGTSHYAWMRVEIPPAGGQITVKDFAYESTPNTAIAAGNRGTVATEPDALAEGYRFSPLAPNPTTGTSSFDLAVGQAETVRVEAFDALGRRVAVLHDGLLAAGQTRRLSLDAAALPAGVYVVRVTGDSFTTSRRVTVSR